MPDGYQVHLPALQQHKGDVRDIAKGVHTAASACAQGQAVGDSSFGLVGQPFAQVMELFTGSAGIFVGLVATAADDIADRLQTAHESYDTQEQHATTTIDGAGKGIPA
ncbi:type VII secretion target [Amycolatopsis ultiminotia]|uniref:Type VII secretion target n=1 Tax=Amycolatopsis ultiminotia TaxID=543629 RepID=A0ABP6X2S4_9PSEU